MILCVLPVCSFSITFFKKKKHATLRRWLQSVLVYSTFLLQIAKFPLIERRGLWLLLCFCLNFHVFVPLFPSEQRPLMCLFNTVTGGLLPVAGLEVSPLYVCDQTANNGICADSAHLLLSSCTHATGWTMALKQVCQAFLLCFSVKCVVLWWVL